MAFLGIVLIAGTIATVALFLKRPPQQLEVQLLPERKDLSVEVADEPDRPVTEIDRSIVDYVGSSACRECHPEIWEKYQSHPMAKSFTKVAAAEPIEDYTNKTEFAPPGYRRYRVEKSTDKVRHHEIMVDQAGEVLYDQSVPIAYVFGSGKRGRGYVIDHDGLLFKSSISWFSDRREWGLSPDYLPESHRRFERRVTGGCLTCHSGLPNFVRNEADRFGNPPLLEEAIGCERCHGPGRKHVEFRESDSTATDPIVNPRHLDVDRREAICAQCHLHGEVRILQSGRMPHDFRPGERLEENWVTFVQSRGTGVTRSGRAASQVEHMVSSTCFKKSDGRMGCISCHDPHFVPSHAEKQDYYRQQCLKCHTVEACSQPLSLRNQAPYEDNCVACHMPSVPAENILHRSVADHRILRESLPEQDEEGSGSSIVFQFSETPIPESDLKRARALKMMNEAVGPPIQPELADEATQMLLSLVDQYPSDVEILIALGNGYQVQNQGTKAESYWLKVLEINPRHESTIQTLALLYQSKNQVGLAEKYLSQFIELNPWHGAYHGRLAGALMQRGETRQAIAAAERGLQLNPTIWDLHDFLSSAYSRIGDLDSASRHRQLSSRRPPRPVPSDANR